MPAAQFVQVLAPIAVYIPAPHTTQFDDPVNDWYVPAVQLVHAAARKVAAYVPVAQLVQLDSPVLGAYWPLGHAKHMVDPGEEANEPTAQAVHEGAPGDEMPPAAQFVHATEDEIAYRPGAHIEHVDRETAAVAEEYIPGIQLMQFGEPEMDW